MDLADFQGGVHITSPPALFDRHLVLILTRKWPELGIMNLAT